MKAHDPAVSIRVCLHSGLRIYRQHGVAFTLGWTVTVVAMALLVFLVRGNLSLGLQLGAMAATPALLWMQRIAVKSIHPAYGAKHSGWRLLRDTGSAFLVSVAIPTVFRYATFWIWMALPMSGGLMYTFHAWGIADMFVAGRLDLFVSAVVVGPVGFCIASGLFFAPLCAIVDGNGPVDALRRGWRMAGSQRLKIVGLTAACFCIPIIVFLSAYLLSVLQAGGAVFRGVPGILWSVSAAITILFSGPWFTGAFAALFVPLKVEEDEYMLRRAERKASSNIA